MLCAACTHLGCGVTLRPGWILQRQRGAAPALFGPFPTADRGENGGGGRAAAARRVAPALPPRHLVMEVGVPGPEGGTYLVDGGNGRSFA